MTWGGVGSLARRGVYWVAWGWLGSLLCIWVGVGVGGSAHTSCFGSGASGAPSDTLFL